jgi:uncharacterized membrane protein
MTPSTRPIPLHLGLLALANACGPGLALWAWTRSDRKAVLLDNVVGEASRWDALGWAAGSALLVAALYAWVWLKASERGAALRRLTYLLAPLAATITLPLLYVPEIERARRLLVVALTLVCAGSIALSAVAAWPWLRERKWLERVAGSTRAPVAVLGVLMVSWCAMMIRLGIIRHRALESGIWDLGIFDNLMHHAMHGRWQTTTFLRGDTFTSAHCSPILQLLAPIYAIAPGPEMLIVLQAVWLASGAIPIYLLAVRVFEAQVARRWLGVVFGVVWLCHPSLHGVALFDFHDLTLAAPMIPWCLYALEAERRGLWFGMIAALLLTREELSFVVIGLGLCALASGRRRQAVLTIVAAAVGLLIIKTFLMQHPDIFMPNAESSYRYANRFSKVIPDPETGGAMDILATLLNNPGFVIQHALTPAKMIYLASLALPTLALFVFGGRTSWALSFGLAFTALGSGSNLHNLYLHYTVFMFPAMVAVAVFGLHNLASRFEAPRREAVLAGFAVALVCASVLAGERLGALGRSEAFMAGHAPLIRELDDEAQARYEWLHLQLEQIPEDASITASNSLGAHVSTRDRAYYFRERPEAEYLLVRESELTKEERWDLFERVQTGELEILASRDDEIYVYRRR